MTRLETAGLMEYFKEAVENATSRLRVDISEETEFYVVDLLFRYAHVKALAARDLPAETGSFAELFLKSRKARGNRRALILKYIGDTTLFLTGYFSDSFKRSVVDVEYYASLGQASYQTLLDLLAARIVQWKLEEVFDELSEKFVQIMDVLAEVAAADGPQRAVDLLRLYERWLRTRSRRDEMLLRQQGIIPHEVGSPKILH
ncbi:MAG: hypothetical protein JRI36_06445 [Deltaproteobacteria bacterium]|nr:hypothetical protein [Deltaproteobacteria bacterium]